MQGSLFEKLGLLLTPQSCLSSLFYSLLLLHGTVQRFSRQCAVEMCKANAFSWQPSVAWSRENVARTINLRRLLIKNLPSEEVVQFKWVRLLIESPQLLAEQQFWSFFGVFCRQGFETGTK